MTVPSRATTAPEGSPRVERGGRWGRSRVNWRLIRFVVGLGLAALALNALNGQRGELLKAVRALGRLHPAWVAVGAGLELVSYVSLGALQRRLLGAARVRMSTPFATALSFASSAIVATLPGGPAFASVYLFRQYRRRGADAIAAVWVLIATVAFEALGLSLLATAGVALAIQAGASYNLIGVTVATLVLFAALDALVWQRRWLVTGARRAIRFSHRRFHYPRHDPETIVDEVVDRLAAIDIARRTFLLSLLDSVGFWAFDCAALVAAFGGVGAPVPWRGLLLAYGAGQLAANLPITPGGLGVVEGSLTVALVAFGGKARVAIPAVLLYRIFSFWGPLIVGWSSWSTISIVQRYRRTAPPSVDVVDRTIA